MTINFNILSPVVVSGSMVAGTAGRPYPAVSFGASGGTGSGYSFQVSSGNLPAGLSLASGGALTGTTTAAGTFNFSVAATDSGSNVGSANFSIVVNPAVSMAGSASIARTVNQTFSGAYTASGGTAALSYAVSAGTLPTGASVSTSTGAITGTATAAGTASFTVTATDARGSTASTVVSYVISPTPAISLATPGGTVGQSYSQSIVFTGALSSAILSAGSLPPGLTLQSGGTVLGGTPTLAGTYNFTLGGTDSNGIAASASFSITITGPLTVTATTLPSGSPGTAYSTSVAAVGGTPPYSFSISAGSLPAGLSLQSGGTIQGTPTASGTANFTVQVSDAASGVASRAFSIQINAPPITISTTTLPGGNIGTSYTGTIQASGGAGTLNYSVTSGSLPAGLSLGASGVISGTPTTSGVASFTVTVSDGFGGSAVRAFTLTIVSPLAITSSAGLSPTTVGALTSISWSATGGTGNLVWTTIGSLPPGLAMNGSTLLGRPTLSGTYVFQVLVTDSLGASASVSVSLLVNPAMGITNANLGGPYAIDSMARIQPVVAGGTEPYQWDVVEGRLTQGLNLNLTTGAITGVYQALGVATFVLRVRDAAGASVQKRFELLVVDGPRFLTGAILPAATLGVRYKTTIQYQSALQGIYWALAFGEASIPAGLKFDEGEIEGIPTQAGTSIFEVNLLGPQGVAVMREFRLTVNPALELETSPTSLRLGETVSWAVRRLGGSAPFQFTVLNGSLPPGLTFQSSTGSLTGTPTQTGNFPLTVEVIDANGARARRSYEFQVSGGFEIRSESLPLTIAVGRSLRFEVQVVGGIAPLKLSLIAGQLPTGLQLNGRVIEGTPRQSGVHPLTLRAEDATGAAVTQAWVLTVTAGLLQLAPTRLSLSVLEGSSVSVPHIVKFQAPPTGSTIQISASAPWLKTSTSTGRSPGFVEVWAEPALLPPGISNAELSFRVSDGSVGRIAVVAETIPKSAPDLFVSLTPAPRGAWAVLLQAQSPRVAFSASMDTIGNSKYRLSELRADVLAPDSYSLFLERTSSGGSSQSESVLMIRNLETGDEQRIPIPDNPSSSLESATSYFTLQAQVGAAASNAYSLLVRSTATSPQAVLAVTSTPWLRLEQSFGELVPDHQIRVSAVPGELEAGLHQGQIDLYDATGQMALQVPVDLWLGGESPAVGIWPQAVNLTRQVPRQTVRLRNPGLTPVSVQLRPSSPAIQLSTVQGLIAAGAEWTFEVAATAAISSWARHSISLGLSNGTVEVVEVDQATPTSNGNCNQGAPVIRFLSPGPGFSARVGESSALRVAVTNACGQPLEGSSLTVAIPGDSPVALMRAKDGIWHGAWTPIASADSLHLEAIWLDSEKKQSATRYLSGGVQP
jgi:hypothetical protein